jgi:NitT/TauT family transport system permease protein
VTSGAHRHGMSRWRPAASVAVLLVAWEVLARLTDPFFLPPFSEVASALVRLTASGQILGNLFVSLGNLGVGFALAVVAGVSVGTVMGLYERVGRTLDPWLNSLLAAPSLVFVPVLFTLFGAGRLTQVGAVFLGAVFVIAATTQAGIRGTSPQLLEMASVFGASERDLFWKVRWPEARPVVAGGLRIGVLYAVKGMVNGEMFIALTGLGGLIRTFGGRFEPANVLAVLLVVIGVALGCEAAVSRGLGGRPDRHPT